ncbi:MAG: NusG domain II-containing protein [Geobacteraceae bacterium]|nr:NusG domain II-containing protein [Geobacteraceae bacterium]
MSGVLVIALISVGLFYCNSFLQQSRVGSRVACVKVHGRLIKRIDLSGQGTKATFILQGSMGPATVEVENKSIRMSDAPCPDRICVGRGWIEQPGESIVCIPNEINIYIENGDEIDAVTR